VIEATFPGLASPAEFTARAISAPEITEYPRAAAAGDTVTITGRNFSTEPQDNTVTFGGIRGAVVSATQTQLRIIVPVCLPSRSALPLNVSLGALSSGTVQVDVTASADGTLRMEPGEVVSFFDAADLACVRLPGDAGAYLVVPSNGTDV